MKCLIPNRKRSLGIVSLMLALSLLLTSGVGAAGGGIAGGAGATPYGGGPVPGGPGFVVLRGIDFKPYPSSYTTFTYDGVAIYNSGATWTYFVATLPIPNGVTINQMVAYYYDNDAGVNLGLDLFPLPLFANTGSTMASLSSSGANSSIIYGATSAISTPLVNLATTSYALQAYMPPSVNVKLVGVRIDYGYSVSLPVIKR
jgi:hypothetical protein